MAAFENVDRVHLVGHSTGGVDAHLLTLAQPIEQPSWAAHDGVDARPLRDRLRAVVSIGSPHQGTCLADDPVAQFLARPTSTPDGLLPFGTLLAKLMASAASDVSTSETLLSVAREGHKVWKFFFEVLRWNDLIEALRPDRMEELYQHAVPDLPKVTQVELRDHRRACRMHSTQRPGPRPTPSSTTCGCAPRVSARAACTRAPSAGPSCVCWSETMQQSEKVIINRHARLPAALDLASNDGVVNSARQLINPRDPDELAAIVVADHFDVVGYYDCSVWVTDAEGVDRPHQLMAGLLHSDSKFGDDEFFKLYRQVAHVIARAAE